jgi:hypothetical protein
MYVLPVLRLQEELTSFLNELMQQTGAQVGSESAVLQCHHTPVRALGSPSGLFA